MNAAEVVEALRTKLVAPTGRHLYGVLGSYRQLDSFTAALAQATMVDGSPFPVPLNVNRGILEAIPDDEFRNLAENEARRPEPTAAHVAKAFDRFLRESLRNGGVVVLAGLEMLFAYNLELSPLRVLATDQSRIVLFLPGRREGDRVIMYPEQDEGSYALPGNLIAGDHLWELR